MSSKPRKQVCIELICLSILSLLSLEGYSFQLRDSSEQNEFRNGIQRNKINQPTTLDVPIGETYNEFYQTEERYRRSAEGK